MKIASMIYSMVAVLSLGTVALAQKTSGAQAFVGPLELQVDNLPAPLGIDDPKPRFSWILSDPGYGAHQSAYEILVASRADLLEPGHTDVWDSGRIESAQSLNVVYAGPDPKPSTRYLWRVKLWGVGGKTYADSEATWWETGLLKQDAWHAAWIGFETPEEAAVRKAPSQWVANQDFKTLAAEKKSEQRIAYRLSVRLDKPVKSATLFAAGEDTVSAWVNGAEVLTAHPFPPYHQMPWKKFVRADVTAKLADGANAVAIETVHYVTNPDQAVKGDAPPMIATLVVEYNDGTVASFASNTDWKTSIDGVSGWQEKTFDDSGWKPAVKWTASPGTTNPPLGNPWIPDSVKALRHTFEVDKPVKSARLYSTALGAYEVFLNGKRVSEDILAPGWTDYRARVTYQSYDVTTLLANGKNAVAALLAPGWYETPLEWFQQPNNYGATPPALRAQLRIEHTDGSIEWVETDPSWSASTSYILSSEIYDGESQDARLIQPGWDTARFNAVNWHPAISIDPKPITIEAQDFQPIRIERSVSAKSVTEPKPGVYVYDFGQNLAGVERLKLAGHAGTDVRLRFSELINDDGTIYIENLRTAKVTDHIILSGKGTEEFMPQFTFHGFRYAEITGLPTAPAKDAITAEVIHTAAPFAAQLKTGNELVDKLWNIIEWGQRSNFVGVPTDCPQRDERLGWMADAQVFWRTATYNMDLAAFSRKYSADMRGTQSGTPYFGIYAPGTATQSSQSGAGWSDAGVVIPWTAWLQTGDTSVIEQNWAAMQKYLDAIEASNPDGLWQNNSGIPFGDWLSPEGRTNQVLIATAYWAYDVTLMRQMAHATGRAPEEARYAQLFEKIRTAFEHKFVDPDGTVEGTDHGPSPFGERTKTSEENTKDTQTGYVLALHMNLLPDALRAAAAQKLVDKIEANHGLLATGFLGTPYLLEELTKTGHTDVAYKLLLNTKYPSWGYVVEHGATTMWERWNGDQMKADPSMNSYNHYAYGAVADWIYRYSAGVDTTPLDAGFHTVVLHPVFDAQLASLDFTYPSAYGSIHSSWTVNGATADWHITLPANTTGWIDAADVAKYKQDGLALTKSHHAKPASRDGRDGFELESGSYTFTVKL